MAWTIEKADSSLERKIVTASIVSDKFLQGIVSTCDLRFFKSPYCRVVMEWCLAYYLQYKKAPQANIQDIYDSNCRSRTLEPETSKLIANFLSDLSKSYDLEKDQYNSKYILDKALEYFRWRAVQIHTETVQGLLEQGELLQAEAAITEYNKPAAPLSIGCEPLTDKDLLLKAFSEDEKDDLLFQLPGAVGKLIGDLCRDDFIAVAAPFKRGKSWFFLWIAELALLSGYNVAYFSMGDMTREQVARRLLSSLTGLPLYKGTHIVSEFDCVRNQSGTCSKSARLGSGSLPKEKEVNPNWIPCAVCRGTKDYKLAWMPTEVVHDSVITYRKALKKGRSVAHMFGNRLKMEAWPRKTAGLSDVDAALRIWENLDGFIPDVIITDYADIMRSDPNLTEYRHQLNYLWEGHDSLAKARHCLVVSGTQTTRASLKNDVADDMVAEDIRKLAHVSLMVALNQKADEKRDGIMRLRVLASRHEGFDPGRDCYLSQNLNCGQFCLDSELK